MVPMVGRTGLRPELQSEPHTRARFPRLFLVTGTDPTPRRSLAYAGYYLCKPKCYAQAWVRPGTGPFTRGSRVPFQAPGG